MPSFNRRGAPFLDAAVDALAEFAHRAGTHPRAPQRLGDVLDAAHRHAGQIHFHERFFDRRFLAAVAVDDGAFKRHAAELGHFQGHYRLGRRIQRALRPPAP